MLYEVITDSIVRGTTSKQIVQMARDAGARKVYEQRTDAVKREELEFVVADYRVRNNFV